MNKLFIATCLLLSSISYSQKLNQEIPEISLKNAKGEVVNISSLKGKVVLLDFWAVWCPPCRASIKPLSKLYKKYKDQGFEIFSVSVDSKVDTWKDFIVKKKINWIQVNDPGDWSAPIIEKWGIDALPTTFLIDKKGVLRNYNLEGKKLESTIKQFLAE
jgi:peroxiredoxin